MRFPSKNLEKKLLKNGNKYVCGIDEVGMGCLAGPVVVCAVLLGKNFYNKSSDSYKGLMESKSLSAKRREYFYNKLTGDKDLRYRISLCYPKTIDKINIYQASRLAMRRALARLVYKHLSTQVRKKTNLRTYALMHLCTIVLVDGPHKIPKLNAEQIPIVKGDRKIFVIACASIIAKVYRDRMMDRYSKKYPEYGFEKHKGYGTKCHKEQLAVVGPCVIHRKSFNPVAKLL
jgi:ribonuclease HII